MSAIPISLRNPCTQQARVGAAPEFHEAYSAFMASDRVKAYKLLTALVAQTPAYDAVGLLGQTELLLGKYRDAAEHLTYAIQNTPSGKAGSALPLLMEDLSAAKTHITTLRITIDQPDADISIDGKLLPISSLDTDIFIDPGKHTISATHATLDSAQFSIDSKAGESNAVALTLAKPPAENAVAGSTTPALKYTPADLDKPSKVATSSPPPPAVETRSGIEGKTIVLIAGGAVTLIAAGVGTYFGLKSRSLGNDAESMAPKIESSYGTNGCATPADAASNLCADFLGKRNDQRDTGRVANISFAVAGTAAVATGLTYLLWPRSKTPTSAFVMVPIATPHAGGLSI